jgi:hypothetical protein
MHLSCSNQHKLPGGRARTCHAALLARPGAAIARVRVNVPADFVRQPRAHHVLPVRHYPGRRGDGVRLKRLDLRNVAA